MCIPLANIFRCCIQSFGSACIYKAPKQTQRQLEALCTIKEKATDPCGSSSKRFTSCSPSGRRQIIPVRWSCGCGKREKCGTTRVFHLENEQRCHLEGKKWNSVKCLAWLCGQWHRKPLPTGIITPSFHWHKVTKSLPPLVTLELVLTLLWFTTSVRKSIKFFPWSS